ncbi:MAG: formimidoylglutamase [Legionellales bacterium]|jgi:formiminoglutamase
MTWQGRIDGQGPEHLRIHQLIKTYKPSQKSGAVLLGFECDEGVARNHGRIGAAAAPDIIRQQMANMAVHQDFSLYDAGNIVCKNQDLESAQTQLANTVTNLLLEKHFPIILGGGHEMAYGSFLGLFNALHDKNRIGIINFDAHFDLRENTVATSGTPFLQIAQHLKMHHQEFHYLCLGICENSNTRILFKRAQDLGATHILDKQLTYNNMSVTVQQIETFLQKVDIIYVSIDLDVFSYIQAPGVSAPAVLGVRLEIVEQLLQVIFSSKKVRLADIAECNPAYDIQNHTARLAAYLTMELIKTWSTRCKNGH